MYAENNPFTPSFGRAPLHMAGRAALMADLARAFRGNGNDPLLQTLVVGARGTGKTAVLTRACEIAARNGWVCASATCGDGMLEDLLQQAAAASAELVEARQRPKVKGVSVAQVLSLEWEPAQEAPANFRTQMASLLDELSKTGTGLVITVDEVRPRTAEMETLASVVQHFVREERRVALIMAGLPHQVSQLVSSESVSFLRRASLVHLGRIDDGEIADALVRTVEDGGKSIDADALEKCVDAIGGFAYMMQLVGFRAWDASGEARSIAAADAARGVDAARRDLERQALTPTWASLSPGDRAFCRSMARGNLDARAIAADMGKKPNYVSKYKQRLLEQGVIEQDPYARLSFSMPFFAEFVEASE